MPFNKKQMTNDDFTKHSSELDHFIERQIQT